MKISVYGAGVLGSLYAAKLAGGAFRVIEAGDTSYAQTDLYFRLADHLGSSVIINNTYDPLTNRLTSLFAARPAYLALLDFDYTYDDGGNITVIEDEVSD